MKGSKDPIGEVKDEEMLKRQEEIMDAINQERLDVK